MALTTCKECGKEISDTAKTCPHCGAQIVKDIYCSNCGAKVPENTHFCPSCGYRINASVSGKKDKLVAGLLALFLGYLGIHYFYLDKTTAGILTIVLSLCTCGIWSVIPFIQGILMLVMDEREFNAKYVETEKSFPIF